MTETIPEELKENIERTKELDEALNRLPPFPKAFYEWTDEQKKRYGYQGDMDDLNRRMKSKLYSLWLMWGELRGSKNLNELLAREPKDKESDEFTAKCSIVQIMDVVAKILTSTDLLQELMTDENNSKN